MRRLLLSLLCAIICLSSYGQARDISDVKNCYNQYIDAIKNDRGSDAVMFLNQTTVDYFTDVLAKCKTYDSLQLEQLTLMDKMMVVLIKVRAGKDTILSMNKGEDLIVYAINNGMVGKQSVAKASMGKVTVLDSFAKAEFRVDDKITAHFLHFYKEGGVWKFDLTHNLLIGRPALQQIMDKMGMTETEFVLSIVENISGEKPPNYIWHPFEQ